MKKIILSIAVLTSSIIAFAQTDNKKTESCGEPTCIRTEKVCDSKDNCNGRTDCAIGYKGVKSRNGQQCPKSKMQRRERCAADSAQCRSREDRHRQCFEGISLSDDQQQRLSALRNETKQKREQARAEYKKQDNAQKAQRDQIKAERRNDRTEARKEYLSGVKEILTPQQYVVFLENSFVLSDGGSRHGMGPKGHKHFKGQKGQKSHS